MPWERQVRDGLRKVAQVSGRQGTQGCPGSVALFPSPSGGAGKAVWLSCHSVAVALVSLAQIPGGCVSALCGMWHPGGDGAGMGPCGDTQSPTRPRTPPAPATLKAVQDQLTPGRWHSHEGIGFAVSQTCVHGPAQPGLGHTALLLSVLAFLKWEMGIPGLTS